MEHLGELGPGQRLELLMGPRRGVEPAFAADIERREAWAAHRDELLAGRELDEYAPWGFWAYEAPPASELVAELYRLPLPADVLPLDAYDERQCAVLAWLARTGYLGRARREHILAKAERAGPIRRAVALRAVLAATAEEAGR